MEDRLAELRGRQGNPTGSNEVKPEYLMPEFNKKISNIQYCLNTVKENSKLIVELKDKYMTATRAAEEKEISNELSRIVDDNTKICIMVKQDIESIEKSVNESKLKEPDEPETRIKEISYRAIRAKFAEVLRESQSVQIEYKASIKQKMGRHVKVMDPTLAAEEVEEIVNDPEGAEKMMASKLMGLGHVKLRNAVADIKDKHKDILKLERSVNTIHQMFVDMALLVQAQGEILDNIELNIQNAENYMKKANIQLHKAKKNHLKSKKIQCCILIILILIILAIVLPIVLTATK